MTIGLFDVDRTGFPNVPLMKLSAWHKQRGDTVLPLNSGAPADRRYGSVVFTWNRHKAEALAAQGARLGGSAWSLDAKDDLPADVEAMPPDYGLYGIDYGIGYLMRGCIWRCEFCIVPQKEGKPREVATIAQLVNRTWRPSKEFPRPFVVLLDNEFFWKERWAIQRLEEFARLGMDFSPSQGLDVRVVTPALAAALYAAPFWNGVRTRRQVTFAFDDIRTEPRFRRGVELLLAAGIKAWNLQSFVLVGFNSTIEQDLRRLEIIREYGIDPFVMIYRDWRTGQAARDPQLRHLARWANRRLFKDHSFAEYLPEVRRQAQPTFWPATPY